MPEGIGYPPPPTDGASASLPSVMDELREEEIRRRDAAVAQRLAETQTRMQTAAAMAPQYATDEDLANEGYFTTKRQASPLDTVGERIGATVGPISQESRKIADETGARAGAQLSQERIRRRQQAEQLQAQAVQAQENGDQELADQLYALANMRTRSSGANPLYAPTQQYIGETRAATEMGRQGQLAGMEADLAAQREIAFETEEMARRQRDAEIDMKAREAVRAQDLQAQLQHSREVEAKVSEAANKLAQAEDVDPGRFWANKTSGQKFLAVLGATMSTMANVPNPMGIINEAIRADIDAQKANIAKRGQELGARRDEFNAARQVWNDMRATASSEREADLMMEQARLQSAKAQMDAMAQRQKVPQMNARAMELRGDIDAKMAANNLELERLRVATPRRIVRSGFVLPKEIRDQNRKRAMELEKQGFEMEKIREKGRVDAASAGAKGRSDTKRKIASDTREIRSALRRLERYEEKIADDVPGVSWASGANVGGAFEGQESKLERKAIAQQVLGAVQEGVLTDADMEYGSGEFVDPNSEGAVRAWVKIRKQQLQDALEFAERGYEREDLADYRKIDEGMLQDYGPEAGMGGVPDPVKVR